MAGEKASDIIKQDWKLGNGDVPGLFGGATFAKL